MEPELPNNNNSQSNNDNIKEKIIKTNNTELSGKNKASKKTILIIIGVFFGLIIFFIISRILVLFVISPSISSEKKSSRPNVINETNNNFKQIESKTGLKNYATTFSDECSKQISVIPIEFANSRGDYYEKCTFRMSKYYGFNGDFKIKAKEINKNLEGLWLSDNYNGMNYILKNYYDPYILSKFPITGYKAGYYVSDLPTVKYKNDKFKMEIRFAQKETSEGDINELNYDQKCPCATDGDVTYRQNELRDTKDLFKKVVSDNKYFMMITITRDY